MNRDNALSIMQTYCANCKHNTDWDTGKICPIQGKIMQYREPPVEWKEGKCTAHEPV